MSILSIFLTVVSLTPPAVYAANSCGGIFADNVSDPYFSKAVAPIVKKPSFKSPPRIVISTYSGTARFDHVVTSEWGQSPGGAFAHEKSMLNIMKGYSRMDDLVISQQQDFSMATMVTTNYLNPQQARMFRDLGTSLEPAQVTFLEVIRDATPEEVQANYGGHVDLRRAGLHTDFKHEISDTIPVKTAALWSIAGQMWNPQGGKPKSVKLPWEKEEARKGEELDRKKYPYVFEWGRAAQEVSGEMAPLYSLNALTNYLQLVAYGGKLSDAYVMVHSFDPVNTRLYAKMTNDGYYPPNKPVDPNDALFITPLEWALKAHPPSRVSQKVKDLVTLSEGHISETLAMDLLIYGRRLRWSELDYSKNNVTQEAPIILNDMSDIRLQSLWMSVGGIPLAADKVKTILDKLIIWGFDISLKSGNLNNKYANAADSMLTSDYYIKRNSVEISNLDARMAVKDASYAKSVIYAAYIKKIESLAASLTQAHGLSREQALAKASDFIHDRNIKFGVTTHIPLVKHQLKKLAPNEQIDLPNTLHEDGRPLTAEDAKELNINPNQTMYFYTPDQIIGWAGADMKFGQASGRALVYGRWFSQYLMSQSDIF